jgi:hypothetical protein
MFQVKIFDLLDMFRAPSMPSAVVRETLYQALLMARKASLDAAKSNSEIAVQNTRVKKKTIKNVLQLKGENNFMKSVPRPLDGSASSEARPGYVQTCPDPDH